MSIFFLVVALLVVAILMSQLTWSSRRRERRSVRHHEQAMDVLRSLPSRRIGSAAAGGIEPGDHLTSAEADSVGSTTVSNGLGLTDPSWPDHDTVRVLGAESPWSKLVPSSAPAASPASVPTPTVDEGVTKPSFVFFADDTGTDPPPLQPRLAGPPKIEDVTGPSPPRSRGLLLALSRTMERPRVGIAVGLVMIVAMATVAGTLVAIMSSSSSRSQRVRQVTAPPTTSAPVPAPPPTIVAPVSSDAPPSTILLPAHTWATISPTTSTPRRIRSSTTSTSPPPTSTSTSPPPTSTSSPPETSAPPSVTSPTTSTSSPHPSTTTTTSTTSTTSTTKP